MSKNELPGQLTVSYFDQRIGPTVLISETDIFKSNRYFEENVSRLIDLHQPGDFFSHYFNGNLTFNLVFQVYHPGVRGNRSDLMLTLFMSNVANGVMAQNIFLRMAFIEDRLRKYAKKMVQQNLLVNLLNAAQDDNREDTR